MSVPFTETGHCRSRQHCSTCRDGSDEAKRQRATWARIGLIAPEVCPFNVDPPPLAVTISGKPSGPVPRAHWPLWAKLVAKRQRTGEVGVGSTFETLATAVGGKIFERAVKKLGGDCGCGDRKARWNALYPY